ncbi:MAG TPA: hypothetical protein VN643_03450 [Pyrinomonadaceae bacterium]|nr:hypothetical protein [Pyrinomonadaceae bacterium]
MASELTIPKRKILAVYGRWLLYGAVVCIFSLNGVLRMLANRWPGNRLSAALLTAASLPDLVYGTVRGGPYLLFELLLRWVLVALGVYVVLLLIASLRHRSPTIFASGMAGLLVGLFALTWLSILILILVLLFALVGWIVAAVHFIFAAIFSFLFWPPVLYTILGIIGLALLIGLISLVRGFSIRDFWRSLKEWLRSISAKPVVMVLAIVALAALIWFVGIPLWQYYITPILTLIRDWLVQYVVPILSWIGSVLFVLVLAVIIISLMAGTLITLGWQFAEQFSSARFCGRNTHTLFEAGFAIGAVMGLALLVCSANPTFRSLVNISWSDTSPILASMDLSAAVYGLMPARAELLLQAAFAKASIPIFDLASLLVAVLLANCSLITGLVSGVTVEPLRELIRKDRLPPLGKLLFGFVIMCAVGLISSLASEDT